MQILIDGQDLHESARRLGLPRLAVDPSQPISSIEFEIRHTLFQSGRSVATWSLHPPNAAIVADAVLLEIRTVDVAHSVASVAQKLLRLLSSLGEACADIGRQLESAAQGRSEGRSENEEDLVDSVHDAVRDWKAVTEAAEAIDLATGGIAAIPVEMLTDAAASLERFADSLEASDGAAASQAFAELALLAESMADAVADILDPQNPDNS